MLDVMMETVIGVLYMTMTLLVVFPLAACLGVAMMVNAIHLWVGLAAICTVCAYLMWRWLSAKYEDRHTLRLFAFASYGAAFVFSATAVGFAYHACNQPPPDGFCSFAGYPFLSFSAGFLLVGLLARFRAWRLGRSKANAHSWT